MAKFVYGIVTAALAGTDLCCKSYVEKNVKKGEEKSVLKDKVSIRKVYNEGMAFNLAEKYPNAVKVLSGVVCGVVGIYAVFEWFKGACVWKKIGTSMTLAGAISNTYDRFVRKHVVDYFGFNTKWKKFNRITFNLGDLFIFLGSLIWFAAELFGHKK